MEGFIGEIKYFAGTYAPKNWAFCEGQQLPIAQYTPLYSIIGIQFGGDAKNYFNLPDLRGRAALGTGQGANLTYRHQGEKGGNEAVQISQLSMPAHSHAVNCDVVSPPMNQRNTPVNELPGVRSSGTAYAPGTTQPSLMNQNMVAAEGQGQGHENMPPWECLNFIICLYGYYPIRP